MAQAFSGDATLASPEFSCDWLVGMPDKETGNARVGCGRYDRTFRPGEPLLADRLVITIDAMQVLPSAACPADRRAGRRQRATVYSAAPQV